MSFRSQASLQRNRAKKLKKYSAPLILLLLTTGCVVSTEDPQGNAQEGSSASSENTDPNQEENNNREIIASSTTTSTHLSKDLQIQIYSLESVGGNLLRLSLGIHNGSNNNFAIYDALSDPDDPYTASRVTLIDTKNKNRHLSFNQSDGNCFCLPFGQNIPSGETTETWVVFPAPPPDVDSMVVTTPITPPILDVPISASNETIENPGLSEEEILDLTTISDNLEDQTGRSENSDEISIILSSDVLFESNSSEVSSESDEILSEVAKEIDEASSSVVNIDGHADNTGSESVNLPLSQERAEEVSSILSDLVTREGVTFEIEGHGSADPIADNDTEEGRERNRRVSVTFEK